MSCSDGFDSSPPPAADSPPLADRVAAGTVVISSITTAMSPSYRSAAGNRDSGLIAGAGLCRNSGLRAGADREARAHLRTPAHGNARTHVEQLSWLQHARILDIVRGRDVLPVVALALLVGGFLHRITRGHRR